MRQMNIYYETDYLCHHGVKGMKWGMRRYQNADGTLTDAGKKRYISSDRYSKSLYKSTKKAADTAAAGGKKHYRAVTKQLNTADQYRAENQYLANRESRKAVKLSKKITKAEAAGKTDKASKYHGKMQSHAIAAREFQKRANTGKAVIDTILTTAPLLQYDISEMRIQRSVDKGRNFLRSMATGGTVLTMTLMPGTIYKVRGK